jgi:hypothetical protein
METDLPFKGLAKPAAGFFQLVSRVYRFLDGLFALFFFGVKAF